jgi:hypothetical protein
MKMHPEMLVASTSFALQNVFVVTQPAFCSYLYKFGVNHN